MKKLLVIAKADSEKLYEKSDSFIANYHKESKLEYIGVMITVHIDYRSKLVRDFDPYDNTIPLRP